MADAPPTDDSPADDSPADGSPDGSLDGPLDELTLAEMLAQEGIELPAEQIERLDAYRAQLWAWNEKLNLTRHTTIEKYVTRDLIDTLELSKLLPEGQRVLDIGSGGGVPGLPLAILRPDLKVAVCESVAKKSNVLTAIVEDLSLPVKVFPARVENVLDAEGAAERFDTLIARAVAPLWKFMFWLKPHKESFERLLLIKGPSWVGERGEARHRNLMRGFDLRRAAEYTTPRTDAVSTILCVSKQEKPKTAGRPQRRPKR